jgi:NAD-dependent dihydropyrimidine dehydrogenase PreA subunit
MHEGRLYHQLEDIGNAVKQLLESEGYEAINCKVNMDYRKYKRRRNDLDNLKQLIELVQGDPDHPIVQALKSGKIKLVNQDLTPYISLRYVAVACGLGRLGWSGNLVTPEYGARVYLGAVVTNAKLDPDPYLKESPCNRCKVCVSTCQGGFFDAKETQKVTIGDLEEEIGKKSNLAKCILSCGGLTGQSKYKTWSTWSPWRDNIPEDDTEAAEMLQQTFRDHIFAGGAKAKNIFRLTTDSRFGFGKDVKPVENFEVTCGVCQLICWETEEERRENARLLHSSGEVVLEHGKRVIKR